MLYTRVSGMLRDTIRGEGSMKARRSIVYDSAVASSAMSWTSVSRSNWLRVMYEATYDTNDSEK